MKRVLGVLAALALSVAAMVVLLPRDEPVPGLGRGSLSQDGAGVAPMARGPAGGRSAVGSTREHGTEPAESAREPAPLVRAEDSNEVPATLEPTGDLGVDHLARVIERAHTQMGGLKFRDPTDVRSREFLSRHGVDQDDLAPEDFVALQALANLHDESVFEASRAAFVELQKTFVGMVERGDYVPYAQEEPAPIPDDVSEGAALGFVPGSRLGVRRLLVVTGESAPAWKAAVDAREAARSARDAAFRRFFDGR